MTATLSTRMCVTGYGDEPVELSVDYTYAPCQRELVIVNCLAGDTDVWQLLTQMQWWEIEEQCVDDYNDRMASYVELARADF